MYIIKIDKRSRWEKLLIERLGRKKFNKEDVNGS